MSCAVWVVAQRLESETETAAAGTVVTSARNTRATIDGLHEEVKAQMDQKGADLERKQVETQGIVKEIAADVEELTKQPNSFKPASESALGAV